MKNKIEILENYASVYIAEEKFFSTVWKAPRHINISSHVLDRELDADEIEDYIENCLCVYTSLKLKASDADLIESASDKIIVEMINTEKGFIYIRESNNDWKNVVEAIKSLHYEKLKDTSKIEAEI